MFVHTKMLPFKDRPFNLSVWVADPSKMTGLIERKKKTLNKRGPSLERKKRQGDPAEELAAGMWKKWLFGAALCNVWRVNSL